MRTSDRVKRDRSEFQAALFGSLRTLHTLISAYDAGNFDAARDLAALLYRIINDELPHVTKRRDLKICDYASQYHKDSPYYQSLLSNVSMEFSGDFPNFHITFNYIPAYIDIEKYPLRLKRFVDWWGDPILCDGIAYGGQTPFEFFLSVVAGRRTAWNRRQIIEHIRNNYGAHFQHSREHSIRLLTEPMLAGLVALDCQGKMISLETTPENFHFSNHPLHAITRHVAEEIWRSLKGHFLQDLPHG